MDLSSIPKDTCPLCGRVALERVGTLWQCRACGCELEFDPRTRRSRIVHFPDEYAAFESVIGPTWLSRREMFERAEEARRAQIAAEQPATSRLLGLAVVAASALMAAFVILAAVAAAFVLSPSLARTRRTISAAYQATPAPIAAPVLTATDSPATPVAADASESSSPQPMQPTEAATENNAAGPIDLNQENRPSVPAPVAAVIPEPPQAGPVPEPPPMPAPALESPLPRPELTLPPTFTPLPPSPPVLNAPQPEVTATLTPQPPAPPTPTSPTPAPVDSVPQPTPTPLERGSFVFRGTVRILSIQAVGSGPNQADEYVELYNEGVQQVDLSGWTLKAIRLADNTVIGTFRFGSGAIIAAGQFCRIYTNVLVAPDNCGFSGGFASAEPIWPDSGGARASLFNPENIEHARFTY